MPLSNNIRVALSSLWRKRARAALILFGIVIGVSTFTSMTTLGDSNKRNLEEWIGHIKFISLDFTIWHAGLNGKTKGAGKIQPEDLVAHAYEIMADLKATEPNIQGIAAQANFMRDTSGSARFETSKYDRVKVPDGSGVVGVTANFLKFNNHRYILRSGRFISDEDIARRAPVCVVSEETAIEHYASHKTPVGQKLLLHDPKNNIFKTYEIVGVLGERPPFSRRKQKKIYFPLTLHVPSHFPRTNDGKGPMLYLRLQFLLNDTELMGQTAKSIELKLRPEYGEGMWQLEQHGERIDDIISMVKQFYALGSLFGMIVFFSGGAGILSVMLMAVSERRKEIGVRRTIGARAKDIFAQFFAESLILGLTGTILGSVIGLVEVKLIVRFLLQEAFPFPITPRMAALALAACSGLCALFGMYPAVQAARLQPAEILRNE